jgi:hypothetical protein
MKPRHLITALLCLLLGACATTTHHTLRERPKITGAEAEEIANKVVYRVHHLATPVGAVYVHKVMFDPSKWRWAVIYHSIPVGPGCQQFAVLVNGDTGAAHYLKD